MSLLNGLVSYYKLDGNSNDSLGVNNGVDTDITYVAGKIKQAASFNGSTSIIDINANVALSPNVFTLAVWAYPTGFPGTLGNEFIANGLYPSQKFQWRARTSSMTYPQQVEFGYGDGTSWVSFISSQVLPLNTWSYCILVYDALLAKVYFNGNFVDSLTMPSPPAATTNNIVTIGGEDSAATCFQGYLDETSIWNRALSQREITQLWNGGRGLSYPFNGSNFFRFFR